MGTPAELNDNPTPPPPDAIDSGGGGAQTPRPATGGGDPRAL